MNKDKKKEIAREYKERKNLKGIYAVRCTATGSVWVDSTPNLDTSQNKVWFFLRLGTHPNKKLQAEWKEHGEDSFVYEVLEQFEDDLSSMQFEMQAKKRKEHWKSELGAESCH